LPHNLGQKPQSFCDFEKLKSLFVKYAPGCTVAHFSKGKLAVAQVPQPGLALIIGGYSWIFYFTQ
jgi:hypothetical protein